LQAVVNTGRFGQILPFVTFSELSAPPKPNPIDLSKR
jgi:hypothetical protein